MTTIGSATTDDGSFLPDDVSDDETVTITSESQHSKGSLSSHESFQLDQPSYNNDIHHHRADEGRVGDTPNQRGIWETETQFQNANNDASLSSQTKEDEADVSLSITVTNSSAASSAKSSLSFEDNNIKRGIKYLEEDEEEDDENDSYCTTERYFIVKSTYPKYSKWDSTDPEIAESDRRANTSHQIIGGGFDSAFHAEYEGRIVRNNCEAFRGACAPLDDDGEFSEYETDYHFNSYDEPPWDSEEMGVCERNEEVIIDIMTMKQYTQKLEEKASDAEYIEDMDNDWKYQEALQIYECKLRVRYSGCSAFYSYPAAQPWDIKAEMEVKESLHHLKDAERKMRPEIECVKSFMFKGRQYGMFGHFLEMYQYSDSENGRVAVDDYEVQSCALLRHLQACKGLEELFLQLNTDLPTDNLMHNLNLLRHAQTVGKTFIQKLVYVAPHLSQLRVLSFGPSITLNPSALDAISKSLPSLERLDISFALSMKFAPHGDDDSKKYYPYENPLLACVHELDNLTRLDLGFEMVDFHYKDSQGHSKSIKKNRISCLVSEVALQEIRESVIDAGGIVTESNNTRQPPWEEEDSNLTMLALYEMIYDQNLDSAIKEKAMEQYHEMEDLLPDTSNIQNDRLNQSRFDLLLEASGSCSAIEEVVPAEDFPVEGKSVGTIANSETADVETIRQVNKTKTEDDTEKQLISSKKRLSNVTVDDATSSKRCCV